MCFSCTSIPKLNNYIQQNITTTIDLKTSIIVTGHSHEDTLKITQEIIIYFNIYYILTETIKF